MKFLAATVTQASNDAFATAEMATGLANLSLGYRVRGIVFQMPVLPEVDCDCDVQLVRRTPTALVNIADRTLIWSHNVIKQLTTSGTFIFSQFVSWIFPKDLEMLIVEDPIFLSIDSTTTSASNTARVRVFYEEVKLSETAKLAALTESLNA